MHKHVFAYIAIVYSGQDIPYSPYHMISYSFKEDLTFVTAVSNHVYVLTEEKKLSYLGLLGLFNKYIPSYATSHLFRNDSLVWILGGTKDGYAGSEHRTRILDLKYSASP